jgi:hypothetical protein
MMTAQPRSQNARLRFLSTEKMAWKGSGANSMPMGPLNPILARAQAGGQPAAPQPQPPPFQIPPPTASLQPPPPIVAQPPRAAHYPIPAGASLLGLPGGGGGSQPSGNRPPPMDDSRPSDSGEPEKKKRKRWGAEDEKTPVVNVLPANMTPQQQECYLCT